MHCKSEWSLIVFLLHPFCCYYTFQNVTEVHLHLLFHQQHIANIQTVGQQCWVHTSTGSDYHLQHVFSLKRGVMSYRLLNLWPTWPTWVILNSNLDFNKIVCKEKLKKVVSKKRFYRCHSFPLQLIQWVSNQFAPDLCRVAQLKS